MEKIVLSLYEDLSYGKPGENIIRFDFQSREQVIYYKEIVDKIIDGQIDSVCFNDLDIIDAKTDVLISLGIAKYSFIEKSKIGIRSLTMYQDREELITHACLLEPFIEEDFDEHPFFKGNAGHQYIYFEYSNKYMIMLSFKECNPRIK